MRGPRILSRYLVWEVLQFALLGFVGLGTVLVAQGLLQRLDDLGEVSLGAGDLATVLRCLLVMVTAYTLPVALLFGVLVGVGRLSADSEIAAMRALGLGLAQLVQPLLLLALVISSLCAVLLHRAEPEARRRLRSLGAELAARGGLVEPGRFTQLDRSGARLLFAERRDERGELGAVLVSDATRPERPFTVLAERGELRFDAEAAVARLVLHSGDIHLQPAEGGDLAYRRIGFGRFEYDFDMSARLGARLDRIRPPEMDSAELQRVLSHFDATGGAPEWARVKERDRYEIQMQRRLALPVAPLLFVLVGVPLGLRRARAARSGGALLCALLVFAYYALFSFCIYLAEDRGVPVAPAVWLPNALFAGAGIALLLRARRAES